MTPPAILMWTSACSPWSSLFKCKFGRQPDVIVRVPGRVNIIGEHIDYCGYPVFPMAIDRSILIAASRSDDDGLVRLCNTDDTLFPDFSCNVSAFSINQPPKWHDYFLCGLRGVLDSSGDSINSGRGLQALVDGSIPPAAGLSSSSALVCGSAVTCRILILNDHRIAKHEIASACSKFEQLIGTQGGGMDQAIQMLAEAGTAKFVQFFPRTHGNYCFSACDCCLLCLTLRCRLQQSSITSLQHACPGDKDLCPPDR